MIFDFLLEEGSGFLLQEDGSSKFIIISFTVVTSSARFYGDDYCYLLTEDDDYLLQENSSVAQKRRFILENSYKYVQFQEEQGDSSTSLFFEDVFNFNDFRKNRPKNTNGFINESERILNKNNWESKEKIRGIIPDSDGSYNYEDYMFRK